MIAIIAVPAPQSVPARVLSELMARQRALALYGLTLLVMVAPLLIVQAYDPRLLHGASVWAKPIKFLVSIGVFALTAAWFFGFIRPERRTALPMRATAWMLIAMGTFELLWIGWQASQGLDSHFNISTPFYGAMYAAMGISAVLLVGTTLPLAWEIGRRPAPGLTPDFVAAVVIGLLLTFVLGGGLGGYMSAQFSHTVGPQGGNIPLLGWNRGGGDLRIAHFLGIHAQQAIPLLLVFAAPLTLDRRWIVLAVGALAYVALTLGLFGQAVAGRALLPL